MTALHYPIHHIAIAVRDLTEAVTRYQKDFNYHELPRETVESFQAEVAFLLPQENAPKGVTALELIAPISEESPLTKFLEKKGEGMHHICFAVDDITSEQERLNDAGYRFTSDQPRPGAHGAKVLFIHPKTSGGVLIELREE